MSGNLLSRCFVSGFHLKLNNRRNEGLVKRSGDTNRILIRCRTTSSRMAAVVEAELDPDKVAAGTRGGKDLSWS